jgi:hypothetical protein
MTEETIEPKVFKQEYAPSIDYEEKVFNHPSPLMVKITPIGGTTSPAISVSSSGTLSEFQIPSKVVNLSKSYISFDMEWASVAADKSSYFYGNTASVIDRIVVSTIGSNTILADISNVGNYVAAVAAAHTSIEDFLDKPNGDADFATTIGAAQKLPVEDITRSDTELNPHPKPSGDSSNPKYTGVKHLIKLGGTGARFLSIKLPLSAFKGSVLSVDKELYFSGETLNIAIYWAAANTYGFIADFTAATPGVPGTSFPTPDVYDPTSNASPLATAPVISNLTMYANVEQNTILTSRLVNKVNTEGLTMPVPVVWTSKQNLAQGEPSLTLNITKSHGNTLLWVAYAPFDNTPINATAKVHTTASIDYYNTYLNQIPVLSNSGIDVNRGEHWIYNKESLSGSAIQSVSAYNNAFTHFDNFTGMSLPEFIKHSTLTNGIDLTRETQQWQVRATTRASLNHNVFWCTQKQLVLTRAGVMLI